MEVSGYLYAALWLAIGIYMIVLSVRESRFFILLTVFFFFMAGWFFMDELFPDVSMFSGVYGWIFRGAAAVTLALCAVFYFLRRRKR